MQVHESQHSTSNIWCKYVRLNVFQWVMVYVNNITKSFFHNQINYLPIEISAADAPFTDMD